MRDRDPGKIIGKRPSYGMCSEKECRRVAEEEKSSKKSWGKKDPAQIKHLTGNSNSY